MSNTNAERFDAYLYGEMPAAERLQFEQELATNAALKAEFEAHQAFLEELTEGVEYGEIREQLNTIHRKSGVTKRSFFLTPQFLIPLAAAASIALIVTVINPFGNNSGDVANVDYQELHQESPSASQAEETYDTYAMDTTISMVYELETDDASLKSSPDFLPLLTNAPAGTAFMISDKGYFLTSKHLVDKNALVRLQNKETGRGFETKVVYKDSIADFAILQCHETVAAELDAVPFKFFKKDVQLGQDVFTLGYPKNDIVYTKGVVSSDKGYKSDTLSFEVSLPSNPGYSGAPLFTYDGDLVGIVIANNTRQQSVTYVLTYHYIEQILEQLAENDTLDIDMQSNYTRRYKQHSNLVESYRPFIFEVHP